MFFQQTVHKCPYRSDEVNTEYTQKMCTGERSETISIYDISNFEARYVGKFPLFCCRRRWNREQEKNYEQSFLIQFYDRFENIIRIIMKYSVDSVHLFETLFDLMQ